jgi:hypothetical protein
MRKLFLTGLKKDPVGYSTYLHSIKQVIFFVSMAQLLHLNNVTNINVDIVQM